MKTRIAVFAATAALFVFAACRRSNQDAGLDAALEDTATAAATNSIGIGVPDVPVNLPPAPVPGAAGDTAPTNTDSGDGGEP